MTTAISLRMPKKILKLYKDRAKQIDRPYQTLIINDLTAANIVELERKTEEVKAL